MLVLVCGSLTSAASIHRSKPSFHLPQLILLLVLSNLTRPSSNSLGIPPIRGHRLKRTGCSFLPPPASHTYTTIFQTHVKATEAGPLPNFLATASQQLISPILWSFHAFTMTIPKNRTQKKEEARFIRRRTRYV